TARQASTRPLRPPVEQARAALVHCLAVLVGSTPLGRDEEGPRHPGRRKQISTHNRTRRAVADPEHFPPHGGAGVRRLAFLFPQGAQILAMMDRSSPQETFLTCAFDDSRRAED